MKFIQKQDKDKYANYAFEVMTKKWLASQLNMVYRKSNQFKERGSAYGLYHPFIIYYLDHLSLLRQAEMKDEETMLFGEGYISIIELGENLFVLQEDYDLNKMRRRLQADDNFDDTCWELEVMQALKYSGVNAQIIEEGNGKSFDLLAEVNNNKVAIECKNKHIVDKEFRQNQRFIDDLGWKLIKLLSKYSGKHDLRIAVDGIAKLDETKDIINTIKEMMRVKILFKQCTEKYRIWFIDEYRHISTPEVISYSKETLGIEGREYNNIKEIYKLDEIHDENYKDRIFFRLKPENTKLKNIDSLIKKANMQISGIPGCIFLKIPYFAFEEAAERVKKLFNGVYRNVSTVKIVALQKTYLPQTGVKVEWKEKLIVNAYADLKIPDDFLNIFSNDMFLNKYVKTN